MTERQGARGVPDKPDDQPGLGSAIASPALIVSVLAAAMAVGGAVTLLTETDPEPMSGFLFEAFMYVGLPVVVIGAAGYLYRTALSGSAWWTVLAGYVGGILFIGVLLVWANLPAIRAGENPLLLSVDFIFFGNLGGLFGFIAGVFRAQVEYNRELQQRVERKNERLDEFASLLTHDLRNPLTVASGRLELLEDDIQNEHTTAIDDALARMNDLIDDVLTLTREGEQVTDRTTADLAALCRSSWNNVVPADGDASLDIEVSGFILADESRLAQALENLFRNSIDHAGPDVTVTVGSHPDGFYIADDGPGIPEDKRDDVFTAGYSTESKGTGMGLSIVQEIIEAHGWEITITEADDGGTRFDITGVSLSTS